MTDLADVRLVSCAGVETELPLLGHFLDHYLGLGIAPSRMHVILNGPDPDSPRFAEAEAVMAARGVAPAERWVAPYTSETMWEKRRELQDRVAGPQDWIVSADVDEFHEYPAPLGVFLAWCRARGANAVPGVFIDRLAPEGRLAPVDPDRPLAAQFPLQGDVACSLVGQGRHHNWYGTVKLMAYAAHLRPGRGGHHPQPGAPVSWLYGKPLPEFAGIADPRFRFAVPTRVHHYKWTAAMTRSLRRRLETPGASPAGVEYGQKLLDLVGESERMPLERIPLRRGDAPARAWRAQVLWMRERARLRARAGRLKRRAKALLRGAPAPAPARPAQVFAPRLADAPEGTWRVRQLTFGSDRGRFHAHSYYDIPVFDSESRRIAVHRMDFADREMTPDDRIEVGFVDADAPGEPVILGESRAWSWQQGPMAQWVPGARRMVWNDREGDVFVARLHDLDSGAARTLPRPVYALAPQGGTALSLNMARLDAVRPGYGYAGGGGAGARLEARRPADDGVWRMDLEGGEPELILSLDAAVRFLMSRLPPRARLRQAAGRFTWWFNHAKISPDGTRFTVKLRWRRMGEGWSDRQGVSLTCGMDGRDLRLLADATSHVIWRDDASLYFWRLDRVSLHADAAPEGRKLRDLAPELIGANVHIRHFPGESDRYVLDTPYREEIDLIELDQGAGTASRIAGFTGHIPKSRPVPLRPPPGAESRRPADRRHLAAGRRPAGACGRGSEARACGSLGNGGLCPTR